MTNTNENIYLDFRTDDENTLEFSINFYDEIQSASILQTTNQKLYD